ncbi:MAG: hypothetical protein RL087_949, partial [Pseudomonadota bacterium]
MKQLQGQHALVLGLGQSGLAFLWFNTHPAQVF